MAVEVSEPMLCCVTPIAQSTHTPSAATIICATCFSVSKERPQVSAANSIETLKQVAQMIVAAEGVCELWAMGVTQHSMGSDTSTAISNLLLVTGNYMRTGTGAYPLRGHNNVQGA